MYRRINKDLAERLIKNLICLALIREDNNIIINGIKLIPKAIVVEAGKIIKYEVELYNIDKSLLDAKVKEIVLAVIFDDRIAELTITFNENSGHVYFIPSSITSDKLLNKILLLIKTKARAECR